MAEETRPFPGHNHNHDDCVADLLVAAEKICKDKNIKLTPLRHRVLEIVAQSHKAIGAYDIIERIGENEKRPAPITIYRVLDFLTEHGFVHRLSSLNAFVTCSHLDLDHEPNFLICEECGAIGELATGVAEETLKQEAQNAGFEAKRAMIEVLGRCPSCQ